MISVKLGGCITILRDVVEEVIHSCSKFQGQIVFLIRFFHKINSFFLYILKKKKLITSLSCANLERISMKIKAGEAGAKPILPILPITYAN